MSLEAQERTLMRLLFDAEFRASFLRAREDTLKRVGLSGDEADDFLGIREEGLIADARAREGMVLGRLVASFPLTVGALSAVPGGLGTVRDSFVLDHFALPVLERAVAFGDRLAENLQSSNISREQRLWILRLLGWEHQLARSSSEVRQRALSDFADIDPAPEASALSGLADIEAAPEASAHSGDRPSTRHAHGLTEERNWPSRPLALAPSLVVYSLPAPLQTLQSELCPVEPGQQWRHVAQNPVSPKVLTSLLRGPPPDRVVIARTRLLSRSSCEAYASHDIAEVPVGFVPLLKSIDGKRSAADLIAQMRNAGADDRLLGSIQQGLEKLVQRGMLKLA
jgi:hypothetical protein